MKIQGYSIILLTQFLSTLFPRLGSSWKVSKNFKILKRRDKDNIWLSFHLGSHGIDLQRLFPTDFMEEKIHTCIKDCDTIFRRGGQKFLAYTCFSTRITFLKASLSGTQAI